MRGGDERFSVIARGERLLDLDFERPPAARHRWEQRGKIFQQQFYRIN